jgi:uncharacterized phage protein (TIGR01671 family)
MEDRYLFKAKRISDGEWVQGYLFDDGFENGRIFIGGLVIEKYNGTACDDWNVTGIDFCEVDPSTICQCTGLKDKNGKLIWENDIVKGKYYDNGKSHRHIGQVKYTCEAYKVVGVKQYTGYHARLDGSYEVIGNIFDNPELSESEEN